LFKEERKESMFTWSMIGDILEGRPNLGMTVNVDVYRLMQFTLRDAMIQKFGVEASDEIFFLAGKKAGEELYKNVIENATDLNDFVLKLQNTLKDMGIGILRVEKADAQANEYILTVSEDLDCSGMSICDEEICVYDEGFISGLFLAFTGKEFNVKEIDCWCSGDRVCRFDVRIK
jgi:predicted hydrocarbon binding protein